jgi:ArsR family transcriptional regulator
MQINEKTIAAVLRAGGHPIRVQILELLNTEGEVSVNDVVKKIKSEQSLTSHHLMLLTKAGFIKGKRSGKFIFYSIASRELYGLLDVVKKYLKDK